MKNMKNMKKKLRTGSAVLTLTALIGASTILPANAAQLGDPFAYRVFELVNQHRVAHGLNPLVWNQSVANVAQNWSDHMDPQIEQSGDTGFYHNPSYASQYPAGWTAAAENIAINSSADNLFYAWVASPSHNANMLSDRMTDFGFGYAYIDSGKYANNYVATQNFAGYATYQPAPQPAPGQVNTFDITTSSNAVHGGDFVTINGTTNFDYADIKITYNFNTTSGVPTYYTEELTLTPVNGAFSYTFGVQADAAEGSIEVSANSTGLWDSEVISVMPTFAPAEPAPAEPAPAEPAPAEPAPAEPAPAEPAPAEPAPAEPAPAEPAPAEPAPAEPAPAEPAPAEPAPAEPAPAEPAPAEPAPAEPAPAEPAPAEPAPAEPAPAPAPEAPAEEAPENDTPEAPEDELIEIDPIELPEKVEDGSPSEQKNDPSDDVLTDANRGDVIISDEGNIIVVSGLKKGKEYNVWFQSTPTNAGYYTADDNGTIAVPVLDGLTAGEHKVAVYETDGTLVGWQPFTVEATNVEIPAGETPATETPVDVTPSLTFDNFVAEPAPVLTLGEVLADDNTVEEFNFEEFASENAVTEDFSSEESTDDIADTSTADTGKAVGFFAGGLLLVAGLVTAAARRFSTGGVKK